MACLLGGMKEIIYLRIAMLYYYRHEIGVQEMKLKYYPDTDSLYIDLSSKASEDSLEISAGVVLDYDADGAIVGIDIDNASSKVDLKEITLSHIPAQVERLIA